MDRLVSLEVARFLLNLKKHNWCTNQMNELIEVVEILNEIAKREAEMLPIETYELKQMPARRKGKTYVQIQCS